MIVTEIKQANNQLFFHIENGCADRVEIGGYEVDMILSEQSHYIERDMESFVSKTLLKGDRLKYQGGLKITGLFWFRGDRFVKLEGNNNAYKIK